MHDPDSATASLPRRTGWRVRGWGAPRLLLAGLLLAILTGAAWYYWREAYGKYQQSTNDAFVQSDAVVVSSKLNGFVNRVFVEENQQVRRGDPLVEIDAREFNAQVRQVEAQLGAADANVESIRAQISEQAAVIAQAEAQLASANSQLNFAELQLERFAPLVASGAERADKLAELRHQHRQASAAVAGSRAQLLGSRRRIETLRSQIAQVATQRRAAEAQLGAATANLGATTIRASTDGRVGNRTVQAGQFVQAGARMMSIVPVHQLYVEANFKETQLGRMRVGQPVRIRVDALDDVEITGKIDSFSPGTGAQFSLLPPQNATGNFTKIVQRVPVRIKFEIRPETAGRLLPGMSAVVTVDTRPQRAVRRVAQIVIERGAKAQHQ